MGNDVGGEKVVDDGVRFGGVDDGGDVGFVVEKSFVDDVHEYFGGLFVRGGGGGRGAKVPLLRGNEWTWFEMTCYFGE